MESNHLPSSASEAVIKSRERASVVKFKRVVAVNKVRRLFTCAPAARSLSKRSLKLTIVGTLVSQTTEYLLARTT